MQINKQHIHALLLQWIKRDTILRFALRDIQIKLLIQRIVEEQNFEQLAKIYDSSPRQVKGIFLAILFKIEKTSGKGVADLLRGIHTELEAREHGIYKPTKPFQISKVFLN